MHRPTIVSVCVFMICLGGCNGFRNIPMDKNELQRSETVLLLTHDKNQGPIVMITNNNPTMGLLFGAIGGLISGSIDAKLNSTRTTHIRETLSGYNFQQHVQDAFLRATSSSSTWSWTTIPDNQAALRTSIYDTLSNPQMKMSAEAQSYIKDQNIAEVLILDIPFYGIHNNTSSSKSVYNVTILAKVVDPANANHILWQKKSDSDKLINMDQEKFDYNLDGPNDVVKTKTNIEIKADLVIGELIGDLKASR